RRISPTFTPPAPGGGGEGRGEGVLNGLDRIHIGQFRPGRYLTGFPVRQGGPLPMPWKETCAMDEKMSCIVARLKGDMTMTELCEQFGVSRDTGYELWRRYQAEGACGLERRSRAPHPAAHAMAGGGGGGSTARSGGGA